MHEQFLIVDSYPRTSVVPKIEKLVIEYALVQYNNKQIEAADYLGIHRNTLHQKIKKYGM